MLCLHMWMLLVRLRSEGKDGKALAQMVYELFQENVEARVRAEGVKVSSDIVLVISWNSCSDHLPIQQLLRLAQPCVALASNACVSAMPSQRC